MKSVVIESLRSDMARLRDIEAQPPDVQERYAVGIVKLHMRINEERRAVGLAPEDTEAWAKHLLEDFDMHAHGADAARLIGQYLVMVEDAREAVDIDAMHDAQQRVERFIREIGEPKQMQFGA